MDEDEHGTLTVRLPASGSYASAAQVRSISGVSTGDGETVRALSLFAEERVAIQVRTQQQCPSDSSQPDCRFPYQIVASHTHAGGRRSTRVRDWQGRQSSGIGGSNFVLQ